MKMNRVMNALNGGYGSYELKISYQKNLLLGMMVTTLLATAIIAGGYLYRSLQPAELILTPPDDVFIEIDFGPPPTIKKKKPVLTNNGKQRRKSAIGTMPIPVEGEEEPEYEMTIDPIDNPAVFGGLDSFSSGGGLTGDIMGDINAVITDVYIPEPDDVVFTEVFPEMIYEESPVYPRQARIAGMEAVVLIKALVDTEGNVKDARIFVSSGSRAGFDEAALAAAYKCKYKPGIQNGHPVYVWVSYKVEFTLRDVQ
jgi:periplasmic protein TonB